MYMYLSDRIRRMFLSGACPQNLSPKKPLSLKDQRFLQKTNTDKNLTRIVLKQQKLLYEKHIGLLLQGGVSFAPTRDSFSNLKKKFGEKEKPYYFNTPIYLQVCCKAQKTIKTQSSADKAHKSSYGLGHSGYEGLPLLGLDSGPLGQLGLKGGPERHQTSVLPGSQKKNKGLVFSSRSIDAYEKKLSRKSESFSDNIWKTCSNYNFPRKSLALFVQSYKVKKSRDFFYMKNDKTDFPSDFLEKGKMSLDFLEAESHGSLAEKAKHASFSPAKSKYTNCRYLYDHESLKTCIVPQLFKNQKPISRAKTLLHERKKIALLYGQLAKKDISNISRKAISVPGFFEDNMFTLLESRVDVCVFRAGFSKTIAGARQLIRNGSILVNGKKISSCKRRAKPGDYFTFTLKGNLLDPYRYTTLELYHLCLSSNFYGEWVSTNKMKFFRQYALKQEFIFKKIERQEKIKTFPESLLFQFFSEPSREHIKPAFFYSLYWGFFLYKLYKIPSFSCFFETKRKSNILLYDLKKHNSLNEEYPALDRDPSCQASLTNQPNTFSKKKALLSASLACPSYGLAQKSQEGQLKHLFRSAPLSSSLLGLLESSGGGWPIGHGPKAMPKTKTKESMLLHSLANHGITARHGNRFPFSFLDKKKNIILLNLYTQLLLKKLYKFKTKQNSPIFLFRKNISPSHFWAIWGQKPLHLEISHKTGAFIYMYKPQKMISPVCLDFKP